MAAAAGLNCLTAHGCRLAIQQAKLAVRPAAVPCCPPPPLRVGAPLVLRQLISWLSGWEASDGDPQVHSSACPPGLLEQGGASRPFI
jgi:hypothetical protein